MLWKTITSHPEFEISENGDVRRIGGTICRKVQDNGNGYKLIQFRKKGTIPKNEYVHRMVALAFIGDPPSSLHTVAHYDGNRANNHVSNLRWDTAKGNAADKIRHGTNTEGENNAMARLTEDQVRAIRGDRRPAKIIAAQYGISPGTAYQLRNGHGWSHLK